MQSLISLISAVKDFLAVLTFHMLGSDTAEINIDGSDVVALYLRLVDLACQYGPGFTATGAPSRGQVPLRQTGIVKVCPATPAQVLR